MDFLTNPEIWISFITLAILEIVLGIDNIIFISVLTGKLPVDERRRGRAFFSGRGFSVPGSTIVNATRRRSLSIEATHTRTWSPTATTSCGSRT